MNLFVWWAIVTSIIFVPVIFLNQRRISRKCPIGHNLKEGKPNVTRGFRTYCDICDEPIPRRATVYRCGTCDFDRCKKCYTWQLEEFVKNMKKNAIEDKEITKEFSCGKVKIKAKYNFNMIPKMILSLYHVVTVYFWHEVSSFETVAKFAPHLLGAIESIKVSDVERETGELVRGFHIKNVTNYLWSHPMTGYAILSSFDIHAQMIDARFGLFFYAAILAALKLGYSLYTGRLFPKCQNNHWLDTKYRYRRNGQFCGKCKKVSLGETMYRCAYYNYYTECGHELCENCHPWDWRNKLYRVGNYMRMEFLHFVEIFTDQWDPTEKEFSFCGTILFYLTLPWIVLAWTVKKLVKIVMWGYHLVVVFFLHGVCDFQTAKLLVPHIILAYQSFQESDLACETGDITGTFTVDNFKKVLFSPTAFLLGIHLHKMYTFFTSYSKPFGESTWSELLNIV